MPNFNIQKARPVTNGLLILQHVYIIFLLKLSISHVLIVIWVLVIVLVIVLVRTLIRIHISLLPCRHGIINVLYLAPAYGYTVLKNLYIVEILEQLLRWILLVLLVEILADLDHVPVDHLHLI